MWEFEHSVRAPSRTGLGLATPLMRHTVGARLQRSMPAALAASIELATVLPPENG
jgi:hypothetical protein